MLCCSSNSHLYKFGLDINCILSVYCRLIQQTNPVPRFSVYVSFTLCISSIWLLLHSLQASSRVMDLDHADGRLKIQYSDRLVSLLREVRQLSALGFAIPAKIQQASNTADKFYRQAIVLKQVRVKPGTHTFPILFFILCHVVWLPIAALQVAHFYNTIDQQMIPSQRPMMLGLALAFEQVIKVNSQLQIMFFVYARLSWFVESWYRV